MDLLAGYESTDSDGDSLGIINSSHNAARKFAHQNSKSATATQLQHEGTKKSTLSCIRRKRKRGQVTILDASQHAQDDNEVNSCNSAAASTAQPSPVFVRSQPHVRGNWAGHVFFNIEAHDDDDPRSLILTQAQQHSVQQWKQQLEQDGWSGVMVAHSQWHISLSRTFYLQQASLESMIQHLHERLRCVPPGWIRIGGLTSYCSGCHDNQSSQTTEGDGKTLIIQQPHRILVNEEGTRSFLTWPVTSQQPASFLETVVQHVNAVLACYQQPSYYDPPYFHVSVASVPTTGNNIVETTTTTTMTTTTTDLDAVTHAESDPNETNGGSSSVVPRGLDSLQFLVKEVECTLGSTKRYRIPLWVANPSESHKRNDQGEDKSSSESE